MAIDVRKYGNINILDISGKVTIGKGDVAMREKFKELLASGEKAFIFNMANVSYLDSAGVGETVACHKRAVEQGGQVKLVMPEAGKTRAVFVISCLDRVFQIFGTEEEALASFAG